MTDFGELAALDAAGALTPDERQEFERALADAPAHARAEVAALREAAAAFARSTAEAVPPPHLKERLMARIQETIRPTREGFAFRLARDDDWQPHPLPGIRMKVLALNRERGYATLLLDVQPGARYPAHHHAGAEECFVISGSLHTCGRRLVAGDFIHADVDSEHSELWTDEGCQVLLIVEPEGEYESLRG